MNETLARGETCSHGTHDIVRQRATGLRRCAACGTLAQDIYAHPASAAHGDFRVVCRTPACDFGHFEDADGHGFSNHGAITLAQAALIGHQNSVEDPPHDAVIQQHPIPAVVSA